MSESLKSAKKVLLSSVFGPYCQDDEYGSRKMNPMELYHNQVTRGQGPFSLRMFHRSWGLMLIQANTEASCILLDFPTLDRFIEEISTKRYDIIGISSIIPNILKVKKMCELIRQHQPWAQIVIGGHIANMSDLNRQIGNAIVVKGDGVSWFRKYLGEDTARPIRHPVVKSGINPHAAGMDLKGEIAATIIPSVGCPIGCNFCSTSAMFGGKGHSVKFYETGDELFSIMDQVSRQMNVQSFFMMDENFLFDRKRALRLLELMEEDNKAWSLYVFTSANVLRLYTIDELIRLGISWVWMGIEGQNSQYAKLSNIDTFELVRELQSNGIRVLGSTIIGLENHAPDNMDEVIDYAVRHNTDFHQFMLYTPIPGTPLYSEILDQGRLKDDGEYNHGDIHGQLMLNYRHPMISDTQAAKYMEEAFQRDFETNGPSIARIARTTLMGWQSHKNHPNPRVRHRFEFDARGLATRFSALAGGAAYWYRNNPAMYDKMSYLANQLYIEFGLKSYLASNLGGLLVWWKIYKEEEHLAKGQTYEPPTFYECNSAAVERPDVPLCGSVIPLLF